MSKPEPPAGAQPDDPPFALAGEGAGGGAGDGVGAYETTGSQGVETRAGFIALIGAPNAGKSTLINALVGAKVAIVTPKVQTTRSRVLGIATQGASQLIFVDTPGIFSPRRRLDRAMVAAAWQGARDADRVALLVDAAQRDAAEAAVPLIDRLTEVGLPKVLVLNKIDQVRRSDLLALAQTLAERAGFERVFMVSALKADGVADLLTYFAEAVPVGPWLYPEDQLSDMPMRLMAAELTREQLFLRLRQELPYALTVETETWEEDDEADPPSVRVGQVIYVERESQRAIVLGKRGQMIKSVGQAARLELADILEQTVHLKLFVKVRERWAEDRDRYRDWDLDFDAS